jgi:peptidoglycan/LPS O-acetylase OafA/YrhL
MSRQHIVEIDGLRGMAALAVALFHYFSRYDALYGHSFTPPAFAEYGYLGVHLFFVISGFCVMNAASVIDRPLDFLWARLVRLYPAFVIALLLTFVVVALFGLAGRESGFNVLAVNLLMVQEYFGIAHIDDVYWTLTLELSFYAWISLFLLFNQLKNIEPWLLVWVVLSAVMTLEAFNIQTGIVIRELFLLQYIEFFATGICIFGLQKNRDKRMTYILLAACMLSIFSAYPGDTALYLFALIGIFYLAVTKNIWCLTARPIVFLGAISYAFYLVHQNIGYVIINIAYANGVPGYLGVILALCLTMTIACGITFLVERPLRVKLASWYRGNNKVQRMADRLSFYRHGSP